MAKNYLIYFSKEHIEYVKIDLMAFLSATEKFVKVPSANKGEIWINKDLILVIAENLHQ